MNKCLEHMNITLLESLSLCSWEFMVRYISIFLRRVNANSVILNEFHFVQMLVPAVNAPAVSLGSVKVKRLHVC